MECPRRTPRRARTGVPCMRPEQPRHERRDSKSGLAIYDRPMRLRPSRIERLPEQFFGALLARVSEAAVEGGETLIDLGRGNPETGPPEHVVEALTRAAARPDVHGYSPFRGLPELREALADRYRTHYGV